MLATLHDEAICETTGAQDNGTEQHGNEEVAPPLVRPALELASNTAVLESAAANVAPAVISTCTTVGYLEKGRLVRVRVDRVSFRRQLGAIWKQGSQPPGFAARAFLETARNIEKAPAAHTR
ncbi:LysR substrate-binding domain-containing protein [Leucobacter chinensis]|uniref:LysR substrate-binding domain-containing protein n=1 Tax=Leucobacter chinensis TaxID=2851010 RepID=UPI001C24E66A|nr:LysR substrate-binding domain-containing protein [Leucobacter chinensis]